MWWLIIMNHQGSWVTRFANFGPLFRVGLEDWPKLPFGQTLALITG